MVSSEVSSAVIDEIHRLKLAAVRDDLAARASFIEVLMGQPAGSLVRLNRAPFVAASAALIEGGENDVLEALRGIGMPEVDIEKMVGLADTRLREAMLDEASKVVHQSGHGTGSSRVTAEEVVQSVMSGVKATTNEPVGQWNGHGIFYYAGVRARHRDRTTFNALRAYVKLVTNRAAQDVLRAAQKVEGVRTKRIDDREEQQHSSGGPGQLKPDADRWMTQTERPSSTDLGGRAHAFFHDPSIRRELDVAVRRRLVGKPIHLAIWQAILENFTRYVEGRAS